MIPTADPPAADQPCHYDRCLCRLPFMWKWQLLRAGSLRLDGGGMFGVIPKTIWSRFVTADDLNRIPLQTNCLLLRNGT